ncbi:nascent polypeptide-associated complex subunit alpha, muscle-specific form-like [Pseudorca crassidens]|uniref:nascent polypeptide-associated complex subunit alpha, muscle-specific form-like n=1 Tax=Pseudorca crassidens TaxID=82174 RepID=UPI00352C6F9F
MLRDTGLTVRPADVTSGRPRQRLPEPSERKHIIPPAAQPSHVGGFGEDASLLPVGQGGPGRVGSDTPQPGRPQTSPSARDGDKPGKRQPRNTENRSRISRWSQNPEEVGEGARGSASQALSGRRFRQVASQARRPPPPVFSPNSQAREPSSAPALGLWEWSGQGAARAGPGWTVAVCASPREDALVRAVPRMLTKRSPGTFSISTSAPQRHQAFPASRFSPGCEPKSHGWSWPSGLCPRTRSSQASSNLILPPVLSLIQLKQKMQNPSHRGPSASGGRSSKTRTSPPLAWTGDHWPATGKSWGFRKPTGPSTAPR